MELRDYQQTCLDGVHDALVDHQRVLLEAPTGSGKTVMAAWMCRAVAEIRERAYFVCHRRELVQQTVQTFDRVGLETGVIAGGWSERPAAPIQIASVQTLTKRTAKVPAPHLLIIDEAHHTAARSYSHLIEAWPAAFVVGLSATPCRLDGRGLDDWFHHLALGPSVAELIEAGWLSRYRLFAPAAPDLAGVHTRAGDYATNELADAMDRRDLIGDILEHHQRLARGRKTIVFATSCAHSRHIVERFNAGGVAAVHLDANTPTQERAAALRQFALGRYDVISNVELFGEGFDLAANAGVDCTVEAVVSARPTQSVSIWLQQVGRALRPKAEAAIILDHAGNALRHGLPDDPREWTLEGRKRTRKEIDDQVVPVRRCPTCFNVHRRELLRCPACGHAYASAPVPQKLIKEVGGELVELKRAQIELHKREERAVVARAKTYDELYAIGVARGYQKPASWARHLINARKAKRMGVAS